MSNPIALHKFNEFIKTLPIIPTKDKRANVYDAARGNWLVDENATAEFLDVYQAVIDNGIIMHTYERAEERGLMVDIDICQTSKNAIYTDLFFERIAKGIYTVITDALPSHVGPARVVITRRTEITPIDDKPGYFKDGVHVLFPSIRMNKALRIHILESIKSEFDGIFTDADSKDDYSAISDHTKWIDTHAARVPVNLIGSCKPGNTKKPHKVIYTGEFKLMKQRKGLSVEGVEVRPENMAAFACLVLKAPGMQYESYAMDVKTYEPTNDEEVFETDVDENIESDNFAANNPEALYMRELVNILPSKYYDDYDLWIKVLAALSSMGQRYRCIALEFSKKSSKFDHASFAATWDSVSQSGRSTTDGCLTKRSIIYWARMENPTRFNAISEHSFMRVLLTTMFACGGKFTHADHAKVLAALMSHKYVFAKKIAGFRASTPCWFEFVTPEDQHRYGEVWKWRPEPDGDFLGIYIMDQYKAILNQGKQYLKEERDKLNSETDKDALKNLDFIDKAFRSTIQKLGDEGNIKNIIKSAQRVFKRRDFWDELDKAEDYIGVANGVLHVGEKVTLIARHHEHPIYLSLKAAYTPRDETCAAVRRVEEIFRQVYPEPDVYDFVWYMAATGLDRRPVTGKMFFIMGGGSNGKSITMSFIQNAMGLDLCASMKMALLTAKNAAKANEADSSFMQAKGKTLLIFDEGSGNDILNSEKVKNMVNCNAQTARELFSIQENFFLHANSFCSTNHPPTIRSTDTDHGFWRRVLFYTAKSRFVENPREANEYMVDPDIEGRLIKDPAHLNAVLSIMGYYYEKFASVYGKNINKVPCPTIQAETRAFREGQDKAFKYCVERIIVSPGSTVMSSELGADYSNWVMTQFNDHITASSSEKYLATSVIGDYKREHMYVGVRVRANGSSKVRRGEVAFGTFMSMTNEEKAEFKKSIDDAFKKSKDVEEEN